VTRFQENIEGKLGEVLKKYGFSSADRLSRNTAERVVYRSESVLIRFSYDRGDVLADIAENKRTPHWYPLQHVVKVIPPVYNRVEMPSKGEIAKKTDYYPTASVGVAGTDLESVSAVLSIDLGQIVKAFSPLDALRAGLLQEISEKEELQTIDRIFGS
jgi:hypothetical protein